jgi:hypothetical protein
VYWWAFVLAAGFLCVVAGFITTELDIFPAPYFERAFTELSRAWSKPEFDSDLYVRVGRAAGGVTHYDPEHAYNGYTLYSTQSPPGAILIDMHGRVVHRWEVPYSEVFAYSHGNGSARDPEITWRRAYLYPDGDLLVVFEGFGLRLWGRGIAKLDLNSKIIWTYLAHAHHDVDVGSDGRIYTLIHQLQTKPMPELPEITPPSNEDFVVVLSPGGKVLKKVSIYRAFANSRYRGVIGLLRDDTCSSGDTIHTNSVEPMPRSFASEFPNAGPNTVLVSFRLLDSIALLDLDAEKIIWLQHGPFARQHDAEFLPDGNMMVFDDVGDIGHGGHSRVLEFTPDPFRIVWEFPGDSPEQLSSQVFGAAQKLPNGDVLITEADNARLIEVTPDKKVVWEYRNPVRVGPHKDLAPVLFWARRYAPQDLHFLVVHYDRGAEPAKRGAQ